MGIISLMGMLGVFGIVGSGYWEKGTEMSDIQLANIEALVITELPEVVVTCSSGSDGQCFTADLGTIKMCGEYMYNPCLYVGIEDCSCVEPC